VLVTSIVPGSVLLAPTVTVTFSTLVAVTVRLEHEDEVTASGVARPFSAKTGVTVWYSYCVFVTVLRWASQVDDSAKARLAKGKRAKIVDFILTDLKFDL
jgi:hypothetical protein